MLVGVLLCLVLGPTAPLYHPTSTILLPKPFNLICSADSRMSRSLKHGLARPSASLDCSAEAAINIEIDDIEEVPTELMLIEGYRRHQAGYHKFTPDEVVVVQRELLSWYDKNRRMLPWRGDPPPWTRTAVTSRLEDESLGNSKTIAGVKRTKKSATDAPQALLSTYVCSRERTTGAPGTETSRKRKGTTNVIKAKRAREGVSVKKEEHSVKKEEQSEDEHKARISISAYGTWVSEVMLQQTRVERVVDYYVKWMAVFPTLKALAEADLEEVNKAWAGLGYYRRARMLHEGAKKVQSDYGGSLPGTAKDLKDLPGIGPYTAGAVASIAFGECEPIVDGNVIRVLSRLKAVSSDPKNASLNNLCWDLSGSLVDPARPGDFNQALMELGATVCTVRSPSCSTCPLQESCLARKLAAGPRAVTRSVSKQVCGCTVCEVEKDGTAVVPLAVTEFPRKVAKTLVKEQTLSVTVVERESDTGPQVLLIKRPDKGLLAGQWECPCVMLRDGSEKGKNGEVRCTKIPFTKVRENERKKAADSLLVSDLGLSRDLVQSRTGIGSVVHVFSHLRHTMQVERMLLVGAKDVKSNVDAPSVREIRWVDVLDMGGVGITTGMKKVLALATKARNDKSPSQNKKVGKARKTRTGNQIKSSISASSTKSTGAASTSRRQKRQS